MRRSLPKTSVLALTLLLAFSCTTAAPPSPANAGGWTQYRGDSARDGHPATALLTADQATALQPAWTARVDGAVDGTPVVAGNRVVAMTDKGNVAALDIATGAAVWTRTGLGSITGSALVDGGTVYAATLTGHVYALDVQTGKTRWDWAASGSQPAIWSSPALWKGVVVVGVGSQYGDQPLESGAVVGLDAASGRQRWKLCIEAGCAPGGGVSSSVAIDAAGRAFAGTGNPDDGVIAFDAASGQGQWKVSLHEDRGLDLDVVATPVVTQVGGREVVAVGSNGGLFDMLDAATGAALWSRFLVAGSAVHGLIASPAFDGDAFYVPSASPPDGMFALDPKAGTILWEHVTDLAVYSAPAVAKGVLVFGTGEYFGDAHRGGLIALSTTDGAVLWTYDAKQSVFSAPAIVGSTVLVGTSGGAVLAFRPA